METLEKVGIGLLCALFVCVVAAFFFWPTAHFALHSAEYADPVYRAVVAQIAWLPIAGLVALFAA